MHRCRLACEVRRGASLAACPVRVTGMACKACLGCPFGLRVAAAQGGSKTGHFKAYSSKAFMALLVMFASLTKFLRAMQCISWRNGQVISSWLTRTLLKCVRVACPARNRRGWNTFMETSADMANAASLQALAVSYR